MLFSVPGSNKDISIPMEVFLSKDAYSLRPYNTNWNEFQTIQFKKAETLEESQFLLELLEILDGDVILSVGYTYDGKCLMCCLFESSPGHREVGHHIFYKDRSAEDLYFRMFSSVIFVEAVNRGKMAVRFTSLNNEDENLIMDIFNPSEEKKFYTELLTQEQLAQLDLQKIIVKSLL